MNEPNDCPRCETRQPLRLVDGVVLCNGCGGPVGLPPLGPELGATPAERRRAGGMLLSFAGVALGVLSVALVLAVLGRYLAAILGAVR